MSIAQRSTDVLILGTGLSGLRAAWAVNDHDPTLTVTLATFRHGPTGSSFTNRNDALGMQLLDTDGRRQRFEHEVMALARPGHIDQQLVRIMAEESEARFHEMQDLGMTFRHNEGGHLARFPGCGGPDPRAVIFDDLQSCYNRFSKKIDNYKNTRPINLQILGLLKTDAGACGAWGICPETQTLTAIRAKAVVMAMGGPAPLFAEHIAGSATPGISYGLMAETSVKLANTPYLQFMWGIRDKSFRNPAALLAPGASVLPEEAEPIPTEERFGERLPTLCSARALHCPAFYHRPQTALDRLLLKQRHRDGLARVVRDGEKTAVGLYAHAGNGGAVVDSFGSTNIPGLFAVGECATGMHGVNRMGGAMVLATQVFGRRAGLSAAGYAGGVPAVSKKKFTRLCQPLQPLIEHLGTEPEALQTIRRGLQEYALFGGLPGIEGFRDTLSEAALSRDRLVRLAALTAMEVTRPLYREDGTESG